MWFDIRNRVGELNMRSGRTKPILDIIFYTAIVIELMIVILDKSAYIIQYESYWFRLTFALFVIKACFNKYTVKQWIGLAMLGGIAVVSYRVTGRNEMLRVVALVAACKDMEPKRLLKTIFWGTLAGCVSLVILSLTGIAGAVAITSEFRVGTIETRYCFGMGHPNAFHCMVWALISLGCYIYRNRLKIYHYILLFAGNIVVYLFTDSRTAVLVTALVIVCFVILHLWKGIANNRWYYILCAVTVIACVVVTIVLCEAWESSDLVRALDQKLSLRIQVVNLDDKNAMPSEWTLFGLKENIRYFDMGLVRLFYWFGIVPGIIYILVSLHLLYTAYKEKNSFLAIVVTTFMIYTVIEAHLISDYLLRNYLFILYGLALTVSEEEKPDKKEYYWWDIRYIRRGIKSE